MENDLAQRFPNLFREESSEMLQAHFETIDGVQSAHLVSNINLVPFVGDQVLILRLRDGSWEIPGGTLEPGEDYLNTIRRELEEEAGAKLQSFNAFGIWRYRSSADKPYRPHLPHPESHRLVGWSQVEIIGEPTNPAGGEDVAAVECVPVEEAVQRFLSIERPDLAELYQLGDWVRRQAGVEQ